MLCLNGSFVRNDSCVECKESFHAINDYYDLMANNYSDGVCNDIIASVRMSRQSIDSNTLCDKLSSYQMKDIRKHWSETLDCPTDFKSGFYLGLVVISVAVLPLILYLTGRLFCVDKSKTLMKRKTKQLTAIDTLFTKTLIIITREKVIVLSFGKFRKRTTHSLIGSDLRTLSLIFIQIISDINQTFHSSYD